MACPTCDHTMHDICHQVYWCPRCGTVKGPVGSPAVPKLVERCREFQNEVNEHELKAVWVRFQHRWRRLGIAESINLPEKRS